MILLLACIVGIVLSKPRKPGVCQQLFNVVKQPYVEKLFKYSVWTGANLMVEHNITIPGGFPTPVPPMEEMVFRFVPYCEWMVARIPNSRDLVNEFHAFYFLLDQPNETTKQTLFEYPIFSDWMVDVVKAWGDFLSSEESAGHLDTFLNDPSYEYFSGPIQWKSFNQWFTRKFRGGLRPILHPCDDAVAVFPADTTFTEKPKVINLDDEIIIKKTIHYKIRDLLRNSSYAERFSGGVFTHAFLNVTDYHRFHVPVSGLIVEKLNVAGKVALNVEIQKDPEGHFSVRPVDSFGYQFEQDRAYIVMKNKVFGYVAVIPIGMGFVSSVFIHALNGTEMAKGDEFGTFAFGGSDIIILFEKDAVDILADWNATHPDNHHNLGTCLGCAKGYCNQDCSPKGKACADGNEEPPAVEIEKSEEVVASEKEGPKPASPGGSQFSNWALVVSSLILGAAILLVFRK